MTHGKILPDCDTWDVLAPRAFEGGSQNQTKGSPLREARVHGVRNEMAMRHRFRPIRSRHDKYLTRLDEKAKGGLT